MVSRYAIQICPRQLFALLTRVQEKKRSFIVVVGDRAKNVIVNLQHILSNIALKQSKSVLWAYKKDLLGFTSHRQKREKKIRKEIKRGIREPNSEDPFELFLTINNIRYVYYKETEKILGNTFGMCILQDFEAITPNLLARTVETVEGGGIVLLLLKGMTSLKQLYTLSMDIHSRYRTEAHSDVVARFNERFVLSLGGCESCLFIDDEMNVLPISGGKNVKPLPPPDSEHETISEADKQLAVIKEDNAEIQPVGSLIRVAKTVDQAKSLLTFVEAISEKTLRSTVTLTAARGRGKSAALGLAIAAAVAHGYSNIFITSPSPENLKTLFEFIFKGFDAFDYLDHVDYTIIQSTNPDFNKAIVRVNVHRQHRQTIQYIQPQDAYALGQAELVVIDEAAAIPLPLVRKLMGPYLVFMASTINGYEGTGRSLSLKLIQQLREQAGGRGKLPTGENGRSVTNGTGSTPKSRSLREITLSEPIRYAQGDPVEKWLNKVLCLDATLPTSNLAVQGTPHPSKCELLRVNRDTLFSYHPVSEKFLQQMIALYVSSHYKNSPNDLQLMSDAPAHQLYVLVPPIEEDSNRLPEPLCVLQVALEGRISRKSVLNSLSRGQRAGGDLIPWLVSQQFQDEDFAGLSGARIVRIATNPEYTNMGYGSYALGQLIDFYEGKFTDLSENPPAAEGTLQDGEELGMVRVSSPDLASSDLQTDHPKVRDINTMPPLFSKLAHCRPQNLDYLGVSFGLTGPLHKFWKRASFAPVYLRQTPNELTGEHSCVMLRTLASSSQDDAWLGAFAKDFQKRFLSLLSFQFRAFPSILALTINESASIAANKTGSSEPSEGNAPGELDKTRLSAMFSPFDLKRLDSYASNMLDYHVILDLVPSLANLYFISPPSSMGVSLSGVQSCILLAIGLQRKVVEDVEKELNLPVSQVLSTFVKIVRKFSMWFRSIMEADLKASMPAPGNDTLSNGNVDDDGNTQTGGREIQNGHDAAKVYIGRPLPDMNSELKAGGDLVNKELKEKQRALIDALPLDKYEVENGTADWDEAERSVQRAAKSGTEDVTVSVKTKKKEKKDGKRKGETAKEIYDEEIGDREAKRLKKGMAKAGR